MFLVNLILSETQKYLKLKFKSIKNKAIIQLN